MSYKSTIVNLDIDGPSEPLIKFALDIAIRFKARLIRYAAADSPLPMIAADGVFADGEVWQRIASTTLLMVTSLHLGDGAGASRRDVEVEADNGGLGFAL